MNKLRLEEILADYYRKRERLSQEIDSMAADPREKNSKRYTKLIYAQDVMTKRIIDLEARSGSDEDKDVERMRELFSLVEWSHKYQDKESKRQLMTIKEDFNPLGGKRLLIAKADDAERELEDLIKERHRMFMVKNSDGEASKWKKKKKKHKTTEKRKRSAMKSSPRQS